MQIDWRGKSKDEIDRTWSLLSVAGREEVLERYTDAHGEAFARLTLSDTFLPHELDEENRQILVDVLSGYTPVTHLHNARSLNAHKIKVYT
jgi:hypothetical protein